MGAYRCSAKEATMVIDLVRHERLKARENLDHAHRTGNMEFIIMYDEVFKVLDRILRDYYEYTERNVEE